MNFIGFSDMDEGENFCGTLNLRKEDYYLIPQRHEDGPNIEYGYDYDTEKESRITIPEKFLGSLHDREVLESHGSKTLEELLPIVKSKALDDRELFYIKNLEDRVFIGRYFESQEDKNSKVPFVREKLLTFLQNSKNIQDEIFTSMNREPLNSSKISHIGDLK